MTDTLSIGLTKLLCKAQMAEDVDFLREGMRVFSEAAIEGVYYRDAAHLVRQIRTEDHVC